MFSRFTYCSLSSSVIQSLGFSGAFVSISVFVLDSVMTGVLVSASVVVFVSLPAGVHISPFSGFLVSISVVSVLQLSHSSNFSGLFAASLIATGSHVGNTKNR
jgi:hypothetical protein